MVWEDIYIKEHSEVGGLTQKLGWLTSWTFETIVSVKV